VTREELAALRPGSIIRLKKAPRTLRVFLGVGHTSRGALGSVALVKTGRSWTDPRPTAWYDAHDICTRFEVTGLPSLYSERRAERLVEWEPSGGRRVGRPRGVGSKRSSSSSR
jgi:hypothetical protein